MIHFRLLFVFRVQFISRLDLGNKLFCVIPSNILYLFFYVTSHPFFSLFAFFSIRVSLSWPCPQLWSPFPPCQYSSLSTSSLVILPPSLLIVFSPLGCGANEPTNLCWVDRLPFATLTPPFFPSLQARGIPHWHSFGSFIVQSFVHHQHTSSG